MVTHIFYRGNLTEAEQSLEIMALPKGGDDTVNFKNGMGAGYAIGMSWLIAPKWKLKGEVYGRRQVQNTDEMKQQRTDLGTAAVIDRQI